jgi:LmbE family N-acetylglucosaminyl deacetylase
MPIRAVLACAVAEQLALDSAALVVAHPDDEVLWFASIVGRVSKVIVAYEDCADLPALGPARRAASAAHPLPTTCFLRFPEPCSLSWVDWTKPVQTPHGMALNRPDAALAEDRYRASHAALRAALAPLLRGSSRVFTHNPWGEYGHPDHVLVSSVVRALAAETGFSVAYSSYVAPRSLRFASEFLPTLRRELTLSTDGALYRQVKAHYETNGCWTWHAAYEPPREESFLVESGQRPTEADTVPLICLMTT